MTDEEVERAIEFLLKSQANLETKVESLAEKVEGLVEQVGEINSIIRMQADSQSQLNEMFTRAITELAEAQRRTETKVDRLADIATRSNLRQDETDARLERLTVVVERLAEARGRE